ncbi:MAG TPA: NAD(P)/FAD-dependent oxidoreductase [Flavobacterium sp.]|jgi:thioredoxin reductase
MADKSYDVIIIGGSAAGLSAALTLARALRQVLIIDCGTPCNMQTPRSHNFFTQDGNTPAAILDQAKEQVLSYPNVTFLHDKVVQAQSIDDAFAVETESGETFDSKKILLCTGLSDQKPDISGFAECWGITVLHCPYCHGYEVRNEPTAIFANGEAAYHLGVLINNWTKNITVLTNGTSELRNEEMEKLTELGITVIDNEIEAFENDNGRLSTVRFKDGSSFDVGVVYASIPFQQQSSLAEELGCKISSHGHVDVDTEQRTSIQGVYAAGDNTAQQRAISVAAASGTKAGFTINIDLILK